MLSRFRRGAVALGAILLMGILGAGTAVAAPTGAAPADPYSVMCNTGPIQMSWNDWGPPNLPSVYWSAGVYCSAPAQLSLSSALYNTANYPQATGTSATSFTVLYYTTSPNNNAVSVPRGQYEARATITITNTTGGIVTIGSSAGGQCTPNNAVQVTCQYASGWITV